MLAAIVETSQFGFAIIDESTTFRYVSPALADHLGRSREELIGTQGLELIHPDDRELAELVIFEHLDPESRFDDSGVPVSLRVLRPDGTYTTLEIGALGLFDHPDIRGAVVRTRPMRGREHLNEALHLLAKNEPSRRVLAQLVAAAEGLIGDGTAVISARDPRRAWHLPDDLDRPLSLLVDTPERPPEVWRRAQASRELESATVDDLEPPIADAARAAGHEACWVLAVPHLTIEACLVIWRPHRRTPLVSARIEIGRVADAVGLAMERDRVMGELEHAARNDQLTGLANRGTMHGALAAALDRAAAGGGAVGLLYVDLDGFKVVNDEHGHHVGDAVIRIVAERLARSVRVSDLAGRLGGDEFAVVCRDVEGVGELEAVAGRIVEEMAAPITLEAQTPDAEPLVVRVGASIGIAIAEPDWIVSTREAGGDPSDRLLTTADRAMYQAKRSGDQIRYLDDTAAHAP